MNKKYRLLILTFLIAMVVVTNVSAEIIDDDNNPGTNITNSAPAGANEATYWPGTRAVRIRVFRGSTQIVSGYHLLANNKQGCDTGSITGKICETPSYDYSSVSDSTDSSCRSATIKLGCIASSNLRNTWTVKNYNGTYLNNYLNNNKYENLKKILDKMGYNDDNSQKDDVVIVEPAALVYCNKKTYFGTSTALMKKNVSYRGASGNVCSGNDEHAGWTFSNVFESMSTALKVSGYNNYQGDSNYSGFGYFKYYVSDMGYVDPTGDLTVEIYVNGTNPKKHITSQSLKFNIRSGHNCTGSIVEQNLSTGNSGIKTQKDLLTGNYSIEIKGQPSTNYYQQISGENYTCRNVTLTPDGALVSIPYAKGCDTEKEELARDGYTISDAITLYNKYKHNGLLTTTNPSCSNVDCKSNIKNPSVGCLSATKDTAISSSNLVCSEIISDITGNAIAFCDNSFTLNNKLILNNVPVTKFYGTSGEFLIKKEDNTNIYRIYNSNLLPEYITSAEGIATAVSSKICYVLNGKSIPSTYNTSVPSISASLDNIQLKTIVTDIPISNYSEGIFQVYQYQKKYNFDLNPIHIKKITGEILNTSSTSTITVDGIISKFKSTSGKIPFSISFDGNQYEPKEENKCEYRLENRIIQYNGNSTKGKVNLEFRPIDTQTPFNRNTMANWSNGQDNSKDNPIVKQYINDRTNSYGYKNGKKQTPIYKITLNPDDIKIIRKYNQQFSYDNYLMEYVVYKGEKKLRNSFLYNLERGILIGETMSNQLYNYKY